MSPQFSRFVRVLACFYFIERSRPVLLLERSGSPLKVEALSEDECSLQEMREERVLLTDLLGWWRRGRVNIDDYFKACNVGNLLLYITNFFVHFVTSQFLHTGQLSAIMERMKVNPFFLWVTWSQPTASFQIAFLCCVTWHCNTLWRTLPSSRCIWLVCVTVIDRRKRVCQAYCPESMANFTPLAPSRKYLKHRWDLNSQYLDDRVNTFLLCLLGTLCNAIIFSYSAKGAVLTDINGLAGQSHPPLLRK